MSPSITAISCLPISWRYNTVASGVMRCHKTTHLQAYVKAQLTSVRYTPANLKYSNSFYSHLGKVWTFERPAMIRTGIRSSFQVIPLCDIDYLLLGEVIAIICWESFGKESDATSKVNWAGRSILPSAAKMKFQHSLNSHLRDSRFLSKYFLGNSRLLSLKFDVDRMLLFLPLVYVAKKKLCLSQIQLKYLSAQVSYRPHYGVHFVDLQRDRSQKPNSNLFCASLSSDTYTGLVTCDRPESCISVQVSWTRCQAMNDVMTCEK